MLLPETPGPPRRHIDIYAREEGVDVRHYDIDNLGQISRPVVSQIGGCYREVVFQRCEVILDACEDSRQVSCGEVFTVEDLVADDDTGERVGAVFGQDVVHSIQATVVGGCVAVEPDAEPDFDASQREFVDGVQDHFGLVAVGAVEADGVGELRENGHVHCDIVLAWGVAEAGWILRIEWGVVHSGEDFVEVDVSHELLDLSGIQVQIALAVADCRRCGFGR